MTNEGHCNCIIPSFMQLSSPLGVSSLIYPTESCNYLLLEICTYIEKLHNIMVKIKFYHFANFLLVNNYMYYTNNNMIMIIMV